MSSIVHFVRDNPPAIRWPGLRGNAPNTVIPCQAAEEMFLRGRSRQQAPGRTWPLLTGDSRNTGRSSIQQSPEHVIR